MIPRSRWVNTLVILLVIICALYLAQVLLQFLSGFADIILLFVLAWLVSFSLSPLVDFFNKKPLPAGVVSGMNRTPANVQARLSAYRTSRIQAVAIVYLGLAVIFIVLVLSPLPIALAQFNQVVKQLGRINDIVRQGSDFAQEFLLHFGIRYDVQEVLTNLSGNVQNVASLILQNSLAILTSAVTLVTDTLLVLLISFFISLDGPNFTHLLFELVPQRMHQELRMFILTVDRSFGGFLRSQLVQAILIALGTAIVMILFGVEAVLVTAVFAGLFMLIPFIGSFLALIPPLIATMLTDPEKLPLVFVLLLAYQLIVVNAVMPKILGNALGLHPMVIIASLLIGIRLGGFWGAFFAMPIAGVIGTMGIFLFRRQQHLFDTAEIGAKPDAPPAQPVPPAPMTGSNPQPAQPRARDAKP